MGQVASSTSVWIVGALTEPKEFQTFDGAQAQNNTFQIFDGAQTQTKAFQIFQGAQAGPKALQIFDEDGSETGYVALTEYNENNQRSFVVGCANMSWTSLHLTILAHMTQIACTSESMT